MRTALVIILVTVTGAGAVAWWVSFSSTPLVAAFLICVLIGCELAGFNLLPAITSQTDKGKLFALLLLSVAIVSINATSTLHAANLLIEKQNEAPLEKLQNNIKSISRDILELREERKKIIATITELSKISDEIPATRIAELRLSNSDIILVHKDELTRLNSALENAENDYVKAEKELEKAKKPVNAFFLITLCIIIEAAKLTGFWAISKTPIVVHEAPKKRQSKTGKPLGRPRKSNPQPLQEIQNDPPIDRTPASNAGSLVPDGSGKKPRGRPRKSQAALHVVDKPRKRNPRGRN